jgi:hypothetical protein
VAGKIDQQLFDPGHGVQQALNSILHGRHRYRPSLISDEGHMRGRKALGQHPVIHPVGATHSVVQCRQSPTRFYPDQYRCTVHPLPSNYLSSFRSHMGQQKI